ncbi:MULTISPECIES: dihydrofolate reductase family protein [Mycolicibacterium]|uniref:Dihydrofolate reductase n=3 Tax=Mycolicibacterium gilvum TaxID=1804 RepID=E6TKT7_MYCSR|nr:MULTISPECIES: dihydrofolate reductase family protein [Mycolicibacterium]ABP42925.1 bifunctional deaminase-reductase-like protein [Mycolicibacterium gilvum PYR-GCK]ADT97037.1 dihydrofolate reductase [Mycolicibacterium gilvum Spyr1]MBV5244784.1 dihydrofolate reductase family protein [Mycolicibacterium sp. PAM1]MCV7056018.1 dihydrofolate reductase [Mycolicibacterium gilvum]STZ41034.1 bifunctional deaminase-reductase-like protein [Mycolicibacterium gilvum]
MSTIYYTASSLDGYIVDDHGSLDWLTSRAIDADGPFGIEPFMADIGSLVMGADTYEWILRNHPGEWMYTQPSWVVTHRPDIVAADHPVRTFAGDVVDLHPTLLDAAAGRNVWVVGGGDLARQFAAAGLIDEMIVSYAPCTLGAGSPVLPMRSEWTLQTCAANADFVCAHWRRV